jgi:hypothetical protein
MIIISVIAKRCNRVAARDSFNKYNAAPQLRFFRAIFLLQIFCCSAAKCINKINCRYQVMESRGRPGFLTDKPKLQSSVIFVETTFIERIKAAEQRYIC